MNQVQCTDDTKKIVSKEEVQSNQPFKIHKQRDTIAPPSSTRGGIDEKTGHNKLVQIKINNKNNDNGKNIFFLKRLR